MHITLIISFALLLPALILGFIRLVIGPSINDRIAALDLMASIMIGFILVYGVHTSNKMYLDIVIVISLVSFIGTIAISSFLKNKQGNNDE